MVAPVLLLYRNSQSPERKSAHIKYGWRVHHNIIYWWPDGDIVATDCAAIIISVVVETAEICSQSGSAGILNALAVAPTSYPSHHWDTIQEKWNDRPELPPHMICPKSQPSVPAVVVAGEEWWMMWLCLLHPTPHAYQLVTCQLMSNYLCLHRVRLSSACVSHNSRVHNFGHRKFTVTDSLSVVPLHECILYTTEQCTVWMGRGKRMRWVGNVGGSPFNLRIKLHTLLVCHCRCLVQRKSVHLIMTRVMTIWWLLLLLLMWMVTDFAHNIVMGPQQRCACEGGGGEGGVGMH